MSPATATQPLQREQELASIIAAYNEVTEQLRLSHEQLEYQVRRLRDELADKNRELARTERLAALGQMAAGLAHEIRNPLGGIRLFASLLEKDLAQQPESLALTRKISSGVGSLNQLVCDILDFAGDIRLQPSLVDAKELIHECVELVSAEIEGSRSRVVIEADEDTSLTADPNQLRSALLNLLRNALDAAGKDGCVFIEVNELKEREAIRMQIADNGPGIPPEHLDKVFNPFFTTKETGTGLGLSMVHRIIDAHGGHIRVTAGPQGGACFVIELPLSPPITDEVVLQEAKS